MRLAIISDIHGNLTALDAVLAALETAAIDPIVCLGDMAATGPQPRETAARLRALGCLVVLGNADAWLLDPPPAPPDPADEQARRIDEIDRWCAARLMPADRAFLRAFQPTLELPLGEDRTLLGFHGSPHSYDDIIRATTPEDELDRLLAGSVATVMAGGHTHAQLLRRHRAAIVLNPGSVGLNPPQAEYASLTADVGRLGIELCRLALPSERIAEAALASGMPHADWWAGYWV